MDRSAATGVVRDAAAYTVVGGVAFVVDFATFVLAVGPVGTVGAQTLARIVGGLVGFAGHKLVAFGDRRGDAATVAGQFGLYAALWVASWALSTGGIVLVVELTNWPPPAAKLAVEPFMVLGNFLVMRSFIFRRSEPDADGGPEIGGET